VFESDVLTHWPAEFPVDTPAISLTYGPSPTAQQPTLSEKSEHQESFDIPVGFYIIIPPDTEPEEVACDLRQEMSMLESSNYGTYRNNRVHFEEVHLPYNQDYSWS
jgi:hypothetical protein